MSFRFHWIFSVEHERQPGGEWPTIIRWAAIGLAVLGLAAIIIFHVLR